jgi:hypothetical protein
LVLALVHSFFVFAFDESQIIPTPGGAISIGLVGPVTKGNPLIVGTDIGNDLILSLTTKSLIERKLNASGSLDFMGLLANCDLANLARVTCNLRKGTTFTD